MKQKSRVFKLNKSCLYLSIICYTLYVYHSPPVVSIHILWRKRLSFFTPNSLSLVFLQRRSRVYDFSVFLTSISIQWLLYITSLVYREHRSEIQDMKRKYIFSNAHSYFHVIDLSTCHMVFQCLWYKCRTWSDEMNCDALPRIIGR